MKYDQDELYLIVDFLEEYLELAKTTDVDFHGVQGDEFAADIEKFKKTIAIIKTLIKE